MPWHIPYSTALAALAKAPTPFAVLLRHGSMSVELFQPEKIDTQQPHAQDELYIIHQGEGEFVKAGEVIRFAAGDVLFVEAGVAHHFQHFSEDFQTFVIFWGATGGEKQPA
jgi:mannose-6-phosphate isomerase-like protein (cupin superfamily)